MNVLQQLVEQRRATLTSLEERLNYRFKDLSLLAKSLCHRSFSSESPNQQLPDNETLEFLGDAVLDLVISSLLIRTYPKMSEGDLSKLRATLVNESHLAVVAKSIGIPEFVFLGKGEKKGRGYEKSSILSSTYEAVIGALFLDSDYNTVSPIISEHFNPRIKPIQQSIKKADAKSLLQEMTQGSYNDTPTYTLDKSEGPDHDKKYTVSVSFLGKILATATAKSKKAAEQKAAGIAVSEFSPRK